MKSVKRKQPKQKTEKALKTELWALCRAITMKRYPDLCYTCGRAVEGSGRQLGHCIPSSTGGALLRYHLDNLRWQCYNCNINNGGQGALFLLHLIEELGKTRVNRMLALKHQTVKADRLFYQTKIDDYRNILDNTA